MHIDYPKALEILEKSTILFKQDELYKRVKEIAAQIESEIEKEGEIPVFLSVMNGGMFFGATLLMNINKPFISDYIHASRYGDATIGASHITWYRQPKAEDIKGRNVYIVDDILDEGHTLAEVTRYLNSIGAKSCKVVVLIDKNIGKIKPISADYCGLTAPNEYLFGCGMDIYGLYRQLPNIYAYNS